MRNSSICFLASVVPVTAGIVILAVNYWRGIGDTRGFLVALSILAAFWTFAIVFGFADVKLRKMRRRASRRRNNH